MGRAGPRGGRCARWRRRHRARACGMVPGPHRRLQAPAVGRLRPRRRHAAHRHREGPASGAKGAVFATLAPVPIIVNYTSAVMAGLVPAIHVLLAEAPQERRGCPRRARAWRWRRRFNFIGTRSGVDSVHPWDAGLKDSNMIAVRLATLDD